MIEIIGIFFIVIGLGFDILACIGLIRLPDVYNRLQANAKCATFGTCCILFGTFIIKGFSGAGVKALLCIIFLLLTAPVAAHGGEFSGLIKYVRDTSGHACRKIPARGPQHRHDAFCHILTCVVTHAFNDCGGSGIPHGETLSGHPVEKSLAAGCTV